MTRFFCDYCNAYLTHDSQTGIEYQHKHHSFRSFVHIHPLLLSVLILGRRQHIRGWKHREAFKNFYEQLFPAWQEQQRMLQMQHQQQLAAAVQPPPMHMQSSLPMRGAFVPPQGLPPPPRPGMVPPPAVFTFRQPLPAP